MKTTIDVDKRHSEIKWSSRNAFNFPPINNELWSLFRFPSFISTDNETLENIISELSLAYLISSTYVLVQTYKAVSTILRLYNGRQYIIFNELEQLHNPLKRNLVGINKELFDFISVVSENIKLATLSVEEDYQNLLYEIYTNTSTNFYIPRIMLKELYAYLSDDQTLELISTFKKLSPIDIERMKNTILTYEQLYRSSIEAYFNSFVEIGNSWYNAYLNRLNSIRATIALILSLASIFFSLL